MIKEGYRSLYQQSYSYAMRDFRKKPKTDVLDKIRAEIIEACGYSKDYVGTFDYTTTYLKIVLQIIDKYKAESEEGQQA